MAEITTNKNVVGQTFSEPYQGESAALVLQSVRDTFPLEEPEFELLVNGYRTLENIAVNVLAGAFPLGLALAVRWFAAPQVRPGVPSEAPHSPILGWEWIVFVLTLILPAGVLLLNTFYPSKRGRLLRRIKDTFEHSEKRLTLKGPR